MTPHLSERFRSRLAEHQSGPEPTAVEIVDALLEAATQALASDVHLVPDSSGLTMTWRLDGVLQIVDRIALGVAPNVVSRLKVMAGLLTYKSEVPQEGRIRTPGESDVEMRVSTFPTMYGEKAVIRLFVGSGQFRRIDDLGLPGDIQDSWRELLLETGGVLLACGPAGSGKTTTTYASLRELVDKSATQRSLVSLEDPIEAVVPGVAQSQINPSAGFTYEVGLKSLMRQDPEVILVGEIRDQVTAETVFQAALTGHLVLSTFHAGSAAGAICRLSDMGIEPYLLRTGLLGILAQRLVRRLCQCSIVSTDDARRLGLTVERVRIPQGCDACRGTGYRGRTLLAEFLRTESSDLGRAILSRSDSNELELLAVQSGMRTRWHRACDAVQEGLTSPAEVRRVFGFKSH